MLKSSFFRIDNMHNAQRGRHSRGTAWACEKEAVEHAGSAFFRFFQHLRFTAWAVDLAFNAWWRDGWASLLGFGGWGLQLVGHYLPNRAAYPSSDDLPHVAPLVSSPGPLCAA